MASLSTSSCSAFLSSAKFHYGRMPEGYRSVPAVSAHQPAWACVMRSAVSVMQVLPEGGKIAA